MSLVCLRSYKCLCVCVVERRNYKDIEDWTIFFYYYTVIMYMKIGYIFRFKPLLKVFGENVLILYNKFVNIMYIQCVCAFVWKWQLYTNIGWFFFLFFFSVKHIVEFDKIIFNGLSECGHKTEEKMFVVKVFIFVKHCVYISLI